MKPLITLTLAALPLLAAGRYDDSNWKAEDRESIHRTFGFPGGGPKKLLVDNVNGYIHVTGYAGSQVQVSVERHTRAWSNDALQEAKRDVRLDMSQQGNFVRLYVDGPFRSSGGTNYRGDDYYGYRVNFDYDLQVPYDTELVLKDVNNGDIEVKNTTGDFDIHGLNGGIDMEQVGGSGTVRTLNGPVKVSFTKNPARESSFYSLNGKLDIYFQPGLNADLSFKTLNGGVYSDFDVTALPVSASGGPDSNGRFIYRPNRTTRARAGAGGPQLRFQTLNGKILLHSKAL